jgi:hypothetical protein
VRDLAPQRHASLLWSPSTGLLVLDLTCVRPVHPAGDTSPLSPYLKDLVQKLYEAGEVYRAHPAAESSGKAQVGAGACVVDEAWGHGRRGNSHAESLGLLLSAESGAGLAC